MLASAAGRPPCPPRPPLAPLTAFERCGLLPLRTARSVPCRRELLLILELGERLSLELAQGRSGSACSRTQAVQGLGHRGRGHGVLVAGRSGEECFQGRQSGALEQQQQKQQQVSKPAVGACCAGKGRAGRDGRAVNEFKLHGNMKRMKRRQPRGTTAGSAMAAQRGASNTATCHQPSCRIVFPQEARG